MSLSTEFDDEQARLRQAPMADYSPDEQSQALDSIATPPAEPQLSDFMPADFPKGGVQTPGQPAPAPLTPPPAPPAVAPEEDHQSKLAALNSLLGDNSGEESAIRSAAASDRTRADQAQMREYLGQGLTGIRGQTIAGPSDLDTEKAVAGSRDRRAALLAKGLDDKGTGKNDPGLEAMRLAEAEHWRNLSETQKADEARKVAADQAKGDAAGVKTAEASQARADEDQGVQQSLADFAKTDLGKRYGVDPAKLGFIKTRQQFAEYVRALKEGTVTPPKGKGAGGGKGSTADDVSTAGEGIFNGSISTKDIAGRDPGFRKAVTTYLAKNHPTFLLTNAQRLNEGLEEYASGKEGTPGARLQASKTAMEHIGQMQELFRKLGNSDSRLYNEMRNKFAQQLGYSDAAAALSAFKTGEAVTGNETAGAYGAKTEGGARNFIQIFDPATPPKLADAAMQMIREQMATRNKQADAALRRYAQSPGQNAIIDQLGLVAKEAAATGGGMVTVTNKKTGQSVQKPAAEAAKYRNQANYEVSGG